MALPIRVRGMDPFGQLQEQIRRNLGILPRPDFRSGVEEPDTEEAIFKKRQEEERAREAEFVGPKLPGLVPQEMLQPPEVQRQYGKATGIGAPQVGERYLATEAPKKLPDIVQGFVGNARPKTVAAKDPFGIGEMEKGGRIPMMMGTMAPEGPGPVGPLRNIFNRGNVVEHPQAIEGARQVGSGSTLPKVETPQYAKADTGNGVKIGADVRSLGKVLGSSLYSGDISKITTKELLQNSIDAVRHLGSKGHVQVHLGTEADGKQFVDVKDNGRGLTKNEIQTVFSDLGSSGKRDDESAIGGFGLAKAAPLLGGDKVEVTSVAREPDGKLYRHTFSGTPDDLLNGVDIHTELAPGGMETGTQVRTYVPEKADLYSAAQLAKKITNYSTDLPAKVSFYANHYAWKTDRTPKFEELPKQDLTDADITTLDNPSSNFDIIVPKNAKYGEQAPRYQFLNNGMWQGSGLVDFQAHPGIPDKILVNIRSKVPEGHTQYPFTANREELRGDTREQIHEHIRNAIINPALGKRVDQLKKIYHGMPEVKLPGINHKRSFFVYDLQKKFRSHELKDFLYAPKIQSLATHISNTLNQAMESTGNSTWDEKLGKIGFIFDETVHGIHIPAPGENKSAILINPFVVMGRGTPDEASASIVHTILHELAHVAGGGHDEDFAGRLADIYTKYGYINANKAQLQILTTLTNPRNLGEYSTEIQELLQRYNEIRGRDSTEVDPLRGTGIGSKVKSRGKNQVSKYAGPNGSRTSSRLPSVEPR